MYAGLRVAVVIPAFDAGERLSDVLAGLPAFVDLTIVVDDGSLEPPVAPPERAVVVRHERNRGVGAATVTGWVEARARGADVAVVVAADGQMDPADLPAMLEPVAGGAADLVKGDRLSHASCASVMPRTRRLGNYALTFLTRLVCLRWDLMDSQCGYTALRLDALDRLPLDWLYPRYGFPNDLLAAACGAGLRLSEVVVTPVYRGEPSGIRPAQAALIYPVLLARGIGLRAVARWRAVRRGAAGGRR